MKIRDNNSNANDLKPLTSIIGDFDLEIELN